MIITRPDLFARAGAVAAALAVALCIPACGQEDGGGGTFEASAGDSGTADTGAAADTGSAPDSGAAADSGAAPDATSADAAAGPEYPKGPFGTKKGMFIADFDFYDPVTEKSHFVYDWFASKETKVLMIISTALW